MALGRLNFDDIDEGALESLVDNGVPEGLTIEYKRDPYGNSDADKKEALKDVTSFANSSGGHLVVGVDEVDSIPTGISGLSGVDPGAFVERLENLLRSGVEPRIIGYRIRAVSLADGRHVVVVRVPKSWNPPHRVSARNSNRFFVRNSSGVHEASVDELRSLFGTGRSLVDRVRSFRAERVAKIAAGEGAYPTVGNGRIILHVIPLSAFGQEIEIDLQRAHSLHGNFRPLGSMGLTPRFNFDGFINIRGGEGCHGYTQIFRNGILEATKSRLVKEFEGYQLVHAGDLGDYIFEVFHGYLDGLRQLDVVAPFVVAITLEQVAGARLALHNMEYQLDRIPPFDRQDMDLPEVNIAEYSDEASYQKTLRPTFDALWNSAGYLRSTYFDDDDQWVGPPRR